MIQFQSFWQFGFWSSNGRWDFPRVPDSWGPWKSRGLWSSEYPESFKVPVGFEALGVLGFPGSQDWVPILYIAITHRYLKNNYQFFDTLETKYLQTRGNKSQITYNKVKLSLKQVKEVEFKKRVMMNGKFLLINVNFCKSSHENICRGVFFNKVADGACNFIWKKTPT